MNATPATRPVVASDRISEILARDEALVEVFIRHSAHFSKLRNRTMRRVMGRLVTVEDASRIAAVPLDALLQELNAALGISKLTIRVSAIGPAAANAVASLPGSAATPRPPGASAVEIDVREDLRHGREPLARIMAAVSTLRDDEVLRVRAIFEPVPLVAVLARRGFLHESIERAADDWSVWFWRGGVSGPATQATPTLAVNAISAEEGVSAPAPPITVLLDVRGLQPPEPLTRTLAALEALPDGHRLLQVNSRVPQLLLPMLAERGFACELDESHADRVLLRIWRPA